jgi:hypothetical protein
MISECQNGHFSPTEIALVIAIGEPRCDFAKIALPDWLAAHRAVRLLSGSSAIHQNESHLPSPHESRDMMSRGMKWPVQRRLFANIEFSGVFGIATFHIVTKN